MRFLFTVNHILKDTDTHTHRYSHSFEIYELPITDLLRVFLYSPRLTLFPFIRVDRQSFTSSFSTHSLSFSFSFLLLSLWFMSANVRLSQLVLGLPTVLFLGPFNYGSFLRRPPSCHDFSPIQRKTKCQVLPYWTHNVLGNYCQSP